MAGFWKAPERVDRLIALVEARTEYKAIAAALGDGCTIGMVCSKVNSLRKAGRINGARVPAIPPKAAKKLRHPLLGNASVPRQISIEDEDLSLKSIEQLDETSCRYVIGDPLTARHVFCGAKRLDGSSYCQQHTLKCYESAAVRRKRREDWLAGRGRVEELDTVLEPA